MKQKPHINGKFQIISKGILSQIIGGNENEEEEEYRIVYINGIPYRIKINKNGQQISEPERI